MGPYLVLAADAYLSLAVQCAFWLEHLVLIMILLDTVLRTGLGQQSYSLRAMTSFRLMIVSYYPCKNKFVGAESMVQYP